MEGHECKVCGWTETVHDPYSGTTVCANPECGIVLEENKVVNDVSFAEGKDGAVGIVGQKVPWSGSRGFGPWGACQPGHHAPARQHEDRVDRSAASPEYAHSRRE